MSGPLGIDKTAVIMRYIEIDHPHRRKHFDFFRRMDQPHFNVCANVDITELQAQLAAHRVPFTPVMVYLLARTANAIPEFRRRIRDDQLVEHDVVHPSVTVATDSGVFGFCEIGYLEELPTFVADAQSRMAAMAENPSMENEPGCDDYLFLSSFPWVSFTGISHAMHYHPCDSVPRITWGKYFEVNGTTQLPLAVQTHHAVVDGSHVGRYFQGIQDLANRIEELL